MCGIWPSIGCAPSTRTIVPIPTGESSAVQKWNSCGVLGFRSVATTRPSATPRGEVVVSLTSPPAKILHSRELHRPSCPIARRATPPATPRRESTAKPRQRERMFDRVLLALGRVAHVRTGLLEGALVAGTQVFLRHVDSPLDTLPPGVHPLLAPLANHRADRAEHHRHAARPVHAHAALLP